MFFTNYKNNIKVRPLFIALILLSMNTTAYVCAQEKAVGNADAQVGNVQAINNVPTDKLIEQGINLNVNAENKPGIKITAPKKLDGQLFDNDKTQKAFEIQKKMDIEDLQALWASTIERNNVVKFAIKKLTLPPEQRRIHSSVFARTVSTLIGGISILPSILGADTLTSTSSSVAGRVASRIIDQKTMPKEMPLTDTELIKLAETVEDLQDRIIKNYYDYKSSIEALKVCRQNIILQNINYSNALKAKNEVSIIASSALYDKELLNELKLTQEIKLHRLELERLAGAKTVDELNLGRISSLDAKEKAPLNKLENTSNKSNVSKNPVPVNTSSREEAKK